MSPSCTVSEINTINTLTQYVNIAGIWPVGEADPEGLVRGEEWGLLVFSIADKNVSQA